MIKTKIYFSKVKESAIIPTKNDEDAGYDLYPCFNEDYIVVEPLQMKLIPLGIASAISPDYCFVLFERGSTGTKGIARHAGVIDSGFRNEWQFCMINTSTKPIVIAKKDATLPELKECIIYPYEKAIAQALLLPVPRVDSEEISYDKLLEMKSNRMLGMLGSSGK